MKHKLQVVLLHLLLFEITQSNCQIRHNNIPWSNSPPAIHQSKLSSTHGVPNNPSASHHNTHPFTNNHFVIHQSKHSNTHSTTNNHPAIHQSRFQNIHVNPNNHPVIHRSKLSNTHPTTNNYPVIHRSKFPNAHPTINNHPVIRQSEISNTHPTTNNHPSIHQSKLSNTHVTTNSHPVIHRSKLSNTRPTTNNPYAIRGSKVPRHANSYYTKSNPSNNLRYQSTNQGSFNQNNQESYSKMNSNNNFWSFKPNSVGEMLSGAFSFNPIKRITNRLKGFRPKRRPSIATYQTNKKTFRNPSFVKFDSEPDQYKPLVTTPTITYGQSQVSFIEDAPTPKPFVHLSEFGRLKPHTITSDNPTDLHKTSTSDLNLRIPQEMRKYQTLELDLKPNGDINIRPKTIDSDFPKPIQPSKIPDANLLYFNISSSAVVTDPNNSTWGNSDGESTNYTSLLNSNPKKSSLNITNGDPNLEVSESQIKNTTEKPVVLNTISDFEDLKSILEDKPSLFDDITSIVNQKLNENLNTRSAIFPKANKDFSRSFDNITNGNIYILPTRLIDKNNNSNTNFEQTSTDFLKDDQITLPAAKSLTHAPHNSMILTTTTPFPPPLVNPKESVPSQIYYIDITIPDNHNEKPIVNHHRFSTAETLFRPPRSKRDTESHEDSHERTKRESKLIEYDGWNPVNLNDPMSNQPTLVYRPPALRRVHFGEEPPMQVPLYPILPQNPPVYVIRIEKPSGKKVDEIYGTETVDYLHFYPHANSGKVFTSGNEQASDLPCLKPNEIPPKQETQVTKDEDSIDLKKTGSSLEKEPLDNLEKLVNENDADDEHVTEPNKSSILRSSNINGKDNNPGNDKSHEFSEKSFVVEEDYFYYYDDDKESPPKDEDFDLAVSPTEIIRTVSTHNNPPAVNTRYVLPPQVTERSRMRDENKPSLYELLKNFNGLQNEKLSASESKQNSLYRQAPPQILNTRQRKTFPRSKPSPASTRRISNRNSKDEHTLPWLLIKTKPDKPSYRKTNARRQDLKSRKSRPSIPRSRYVYNPELQQYVSKQRSTESLTADSLSELLQIFDYITTPRPFRPVTQRTRSTNTFQTFRYTKSASDDESIVTTTRRPTLIEILPQEAPPTTRLTDNYPIRTSFRRPQTSAEDSVVQTNSLDGYLFSDSEAKPKYSRPNRVRNVIKVEPQKPQTERPKPVSKPMDNDAHRRGDIPTTIITDVETTTATTEKSVSYRIFEGHSKVKFFGGVPLSRRTSRRKQRKDHPDRHNGTLTSMDPVTSSTTATESAKKVPVVTMPDPLVKVIPLPVLDHSKFNIAPKVVSTPKSKDVTWVSTEPEVTTSVTTEPDGQIGSFLPSALAAFSRLFYGDSSAEISAPEIQDTRQNDTTDFI